ncbi:unnamed protein product [Adineta ricciae]|uniref:Uncharacterized protein n=2 Tax=Adineta ricciae TaxID=249248 RepID=A0A815GA34_ADIRI|nr:unnamed protein product [Adineta ricciae]
MDVVSQVDQQSCDTTLYDQSSLMTFQMPSTRINQNYIIVWLDNIFAEVNSADCLNIVTKLREVVNSVQTFIDVDACIDFISDTEDEKIFLIVSGLFGQTIVPIVHNFPQMHSIYIFSGQVLAQEQWIGEWKKIKGVYMNVNSICEVLKQSADICDQNYVALSFIKTSDDTKNKTLDELDRSFVFIQILKEILPTLHFNQQHLHDFLEYCRQEIFVDNDIEMYNIDQIEQEYYLHRPIWWLTSDCFLFSMLNRVLRTLEMDLVTKMSFFIHDLQQQIIDLHKEQFDQENKSNTYTVYRGQGISRSDFEQLKDTQGGIVIFNNFMLTTLNRSSSLAFVQDNSNMIGVIFEITINLSTSSPVFALIREASYYQNEEKVIFALHSMFRIGDIKPIQETNEPLWQVHLTLTDDNNVQLQNLADIIRKETRSSHHGWQRLGNYMLKLNKFDEAEHIFLYVLNGTDNEQEKAGIYHALGLINHNQSKYSEAIELYQKAIEINQRVLPAYHTDLADSYSSIGSSYSRMNEHSQALLYHEKAFEIYQKTLSPDHLDLAVCYINFGEVFHNLSRYSDALFNHQKALKIKLKVLSPDHPEVASCYSFIGTVYNTMGEYSKALASHKEALEIRLKSLRANHPDLATSYKNIGEVYSNLNAYSEALIYHKKALEIELNILPPYHHSLALSYNNIGSVYDELNDYPNALSNYEKALQIFQEILPPNHPSFAISYNNIAGVYSSLKEYLNALLYYKKALEISHKTLPANHPYFAPLYGHIGMVYAHIGDHSTALGYYEQALHLSQQSLPSNHPHLQLYKDGIDYIKNNL